MHRSAFRFIAWLLALAFARAALAQPLPDVDQPLLQIEGRIAAPGKVSLSIRDLERLPQHRFATATPWSKEVRTYSGPLLRDVLRHVGAQGSQLNALALNEYRIDIPVEDAQRHDVIIATRINGQLIPVRKLGPLFVIYPFDQQPALRSTRYYDRSIWQLKALTVQ